MTPNEWDSEIRDWEGAAFDPTALRFFSLLPDEDADEAYCVRHDREMRQIDPVIHTQGALYTTEETFSIYVCERCIKEIAVREPVLDTGIKAYRLKLMQAFSLWDEGEAPGDWFQYIGEGDIDEETGAIFFGEGDHE